MFGKQDGVKGFMPSQMELVRLALPRRVYTQSHVDRILEIAADVAARKSLLRGMRMTHRPKSLPHFTARFEPLESPARV
jgi:tryptophanase